MAGISFILSLILLAVNLTLVCNVDQPHWYSIVLIPVLVITTIVTFFDMTDPYS